MKAFFVVLLVVSILFPFYLFMASARDFAHNQFKVRSERLEDSARPAPLSAHFGLTAAQLAGLDDLTRSAYKDAVYDGYRLGNGYERLSFGTLAIDALLFAASVVSLRRSRMSGRLANQMQ